ncbi:MAG: polymer-forming cytoskeletal protein [Oscillospiraceae bacterium]|nr:polymer-forming cytoskeletal protein [Oscillospiraceae bacterium]
MSLKDNFNQAVKEILKKDGLVGEELSKESKKKSELDRYLDPPRPVEQAAPVQEPEFEPEQPAVSAAAASAPTEPIAEPEPEPMPSYNSNPYVQTAQTAAGFGTRPQQSDPFASSRANADPFGTNYGGYGGAVPPPPPRTPNNPPPYRGGGNDTPYYETEETTVISRNTIIDGNIRSFANINIDGSVKGDVKITKNISVTGKVVGDIECNNSVMTGASMQGNVNSKGQVQLDRDSILLGDITAQYLDLNGKIKGNIDVGGKAEFKTDAIVLGNITASTITVLDGATIQGYVNTTFLQESSSSIFPDAIAVTE